MLVLPVITAGAGLIVTGLVTVHPEPNEYVITAAPATIPVTIPLSDPIVAEAVLLLHAPPGTRSLKVALAPAHTVAAPEIAAGEVLTVTIAIAIQPVGKV